MKRLLVTGGAGFIGVNFVYYWMDRYPDDQIIVLDVLSYAGNKFSLDKALKNSKVQFVHGNILDRSLVENLLIQNRIDTIVHFAAESHVDRSIKGPDAFIETNIVGTHELLKAARNVWLEQKTNITHRFHHISTDEVFGSLKPDEKPFSEITSYSPNSPYAASKASSDHLVRAYHKTYGLNTTISNCSNNYGPFQFPEKLIPLIIINILLGKELPVYGDGRQIRDWLYVDDHNHGVDLILRNGTEGQTYNIGGSNEWMNIDIVNLICDLMHRELTENQDLKKRFEKYSLMRDDHPNNLIAYVSDRPGHDRRYAINPEKMQKELGYKPKYSFQAGIEKTIQWYLENEQWWNKVIDGSYKNWIESHYTTNNI